MTLMCEIMLLILVYLSLSDYVDELFEEAFCFRKEATTDIVPSPMSHMYRKPDEDRQALLDAYTTRFVS